MVKTGHTVNKTNKPQQLNFVSPNKTNECETVADNHHICTALVKDAKLPNAANISQ